MLALRLKNPPPLDVIASALAPRGRFWLDGHPAHPEGRWAFLGAEPEEVRRATFGEPAFALFEHLTEPDGSLEGDAIALEPGSVPRWVGYVSYDAAWSEPRALGLRMVPRHARGGRTIAWLGRYERLFAVDLERDEVFALGPTPEDCEALAALVEGQAHGPTARVGTVTGEDPARHRRAVEHALEAIAAGEIHQVNLARRWRAPFEGDPLALWLPMREASPVPLGFFLDAEGTSVLARTMERYLRWERRSRRLWTSPIKGTIARSSDDGRDARALRADAKEHAEHAIIIDLMRSDLSRVAEAGTVEIDSALRVEPFARLSHLVSTISCRTAEALDARALLEATFPPGSISGAPKRAAMELIEREEPWARGIYTGAVGHIDRAGGLSLAVAIRTALIENGEVSYFAGGGLVSASDPAREVAETELKARVFLDAIEALIQTEGV